MSKSIIMYVGVYTQTIGPTYAYMYIRVHV